VNTLEDCITRRGSPNKLISDSAQVIIGDKVKDILRTICIDSWKSEPYHKYQNATERRYQTDNAESFGGDIDDDIAPVLGSHHDFNNEDTKLHTTNDNHPPPSIIDMEDLIGRFFIMDNQDDGQQFRERIVKIIEDHDKRLENEKDRVKVLLSPNGNTREEVITYKCLLG
jgi:hypothetical protein